jgi:hypothetical protein
VLGHLFPSIVRQGFPQQGGHMPEFLREALAALRASIPSIRARRTRRVVRSTRGPDGRPIAGPLDQVAFPVARHVRVATSAGRSAIGVMWGIWPRRSVPRARGRRALRA